MKHTLKPNYMPWLTLLAGFVGFLLRIILFLGEDEKGLLPAESIVSNLTFVLLAAVLVCLYLCVQPLSAMSRYAELFPPSVYRAVGCALGAFGILWVGIRSLSSQSGFLCVATFLFSVAGAASLGYVAFCRIKGKRPAFVFHALVTVFFMLYTVFQCQAWGTESELQRFCYQLFSCIFLMLTAYHYALLDAQVSSRRRLVFFSQSALFCCCLSLCGGDLLFYISMVGWLALDLCSVATPRRQAPKEEA